MAVVFLEGLRQNHWTPLIVHTPSQALAVPERLMVAEDLAREAVKADVPIKEPESSSR